MQSVEWLPAFWGLYCLCLQGIGFCPASGITCSFSATVHLFISDIIPSYILALHNCSFLFMLLNWLMPQMWLVIAPCNWDMLLCCPGISEIKMCIVVPMYVHVYLVKAWWNGAVKFYPAAGGSTFLQKMIAICWAMWHHISEDSYVEETVCHRKHVARWIILKFHAVCVSFQTPKRLFSLELIAPLSTLHMFNDVKMY